MRIPVPALLILLAACKTPGGEFPSLLPRPNEAPREIPPMETGPVQLPDEARQGLVADIVREESALAAARAAIAAARKNLMAALSPARGAAAGSDAWVEAQLALSRFDTERAILGDIDTRLADAVALAADLADDDPDRQRLEALRQDLTTAIDDSAHAAATARAALEAA